MSVLYTPKDIQRALTDLRIKPHVVEVDGQEIPTLSTREVARILTWRAWEEENVNHTYPDSAVRRHKQGKNIIPVEVSSGGNRWTVESAFEVPLAPRRGLARQKKESNT